MDHRLKRLLLNKEMINLMTRDILSIINDDLEINYIDYHVFRNDLSFKFNLEYRNDEYLRNNHLYLIK